MEDYYEFQIFIQSNGEYVNLVIYTHQSSSFPISFVFGGFSEYTAFHDVGFFYVFLFYTKGAVRENFKYYGQES